ncbi:MAG: zinc ribbon domain-containing protein [Planctomycetota bacterium]
MNSQSSINKCECGEQLKPGFKVCPICGKQVSSLCPSCQKPIKSEWNVCPNCSTALRSGAIPTPKAKLRREKSFDESDLRVKRQYSEKKLPEFEDIDEVREIKPQAPEEDVIETATENLPVCIPKTPQIIKKEVEKRNSVEPEAPEKIKYEKLWSLSAKKYKGGSGKAIKIAGQPSISYSTSSGFILKGRYDPPCTGWWAILATIITGIVITALAQAFGFMAGPGYIIWYYIIRSKRRRDINEKLQNIKEVVFDNERKSLALFTQFQDKNVWLGFRVEKDYEKLVNAFSAVLKERCRAGKLKHADALAITILLIIVGLAVIFMLIQLSNL